MQADNAIVRSWGEPLTNPGLLNHVDLVERLGIADQAKGTDVAGAAKLTCARV